MSRVVAIAALLLAAGGVHAGDDLATLTPDALVARWRAAPREQRPALERAIRARGAPCLKALRAVGEDASLAQRAGAGRMMARIRNDWARKHVPKGMVYIPAGPLEVPRAKAPWGPSGTRRIVGAFYIDRTEVTVGAWRTWRKACIEKAPHEPGVHRLWQPPKDMPDDMPVVRVRWPEAKRYAAEARGGRLPTADEFERALRGSGVGTWPWGAEMRAGHANLRGFGPNRPVRVGSHPQGASAFGVQDLVGNVAEWSATTVTQGSSKGEYPLTLGGSFRDNPGEELTWRGLGRMRARVGPRARGVDWLGFRVVRDVPSIPE